MVRHKLKGGMRPVFIRKKLNKNGFTFVEVMATVAVIVILLAVSGVAAAQYRDYLQIAELDNAAREIYMAAENRAVLLASSGQLNGLVQRDAYQLSLDEGAAGYYITKYDSALGELLPVNSVEQSLRDGFFYIVYEPVSGCVTDVFFARQPLNTLVGGDFQAFYDTWRNADSRSRMKQTPMLGYFGGGLAEGTDIEAISTASVMVQIENGEELKVMVSCNLPSGLTLSSPGVRLKVTLSQDNGGAPKVIELNAVAAETVTRDSYTWVLDSLEGPHFKELGSGLIPGADFTISGELTSDDNRFLPASARASNNSLFAYGAESGGGTARLQYLRHLQNLDSAFSGVQGKTKALLVADIDCAGYEFVPIINNDLQQFSGSQYEVASEAEIFKIRNLQVTADSAGGRPGGLFAQAFDCSFSNVRLVNAHVDALNMAKPMAAGALTGEADNCTFAGCQAYWEPVDGFSLQSLLGSNEDGVGYKYQILGEAAGGLVGRMNGGSLNHCLAATLVQGNTVAGGLVGQSLGNVDIYNSYGDCYLLSEKTAAGLVGNGDTVNLDNCYAAGFIDMSRANSGAGLCAGSGKTSAANTYSVIRCFDKADSALFYALTETQDTPNNDSFNNVFYLGVGQAGTIDGQKAIGLSYGDMSSQNFAGGLGSAFNWKDSQSSRPYNLRKDLQLVLYSFPGLQDLPHYGDWGAEFKEPSLVYYEKYSDGSYGFSGGNARYLISGGMADSKAVEKDGYAVAFLSEELKDLGTGSIGLSYSWFDGGQLKTAVNNVAQSELWTAFSQAENGAAVSQKYYLAPLPDTLVNSDYAGEEFYRYLKFSLEIGSNVASGEYFYNPHFAETVIPFVQPEGETVVWDATLAAGYGARLTEELAAVKIRTPRQLYNLSRFVNYYHNVKYHYVFQQNLPLNYGSYTGYGLFSQGGDYYLQRPIGNYDKPFNGVYQGNCYQIKGVGFYAPTDVTPYYAGLFGYSEGVLRDIVYQLNTPDSSRRLSLNSSNGSVNLYVGGLLGGNAGTVQNCAVEGLWLEGFAFGAPLYAGGLVGQNNGNINCSMAEAAFMSSDGSGYARSWLGGLVGYNTRSITSSYGVGRLSATVDDTSTASVCGFAGFNNGSISGCYAASDLQSSGLNVDSFGFCGQGGLSNCFYLNEGNFTYRQTSYIASYAEGQARAVRYGDLAGDSSLLPDMWPPAAEGYPYPRSVKNNGAAVHYGDWPVPLELGEMGIYYWEKLQLGDKATYHLSLLGVNPKAENENGEAIQTITKESTLAEVYNDGGVVTDYGYGYYNVAGSEVKLMAENICYTGNGSSAAPEDFSTQIASDGQVDKALADLMPGYAFHSWHSFSPDEEGRGSGLYPGSYTKDWWGNYSVSTVRNGRFVLAQNGREGNLKVEFFLDPHFADAMSVDFSAGKRPSGNWQVESDLLAEPGSASNPYGVRSVAQLEFINWNSTTRNTRTVLEMQTNNTHFPYLSYEGKTSKYYWRQSHDLNGAGQTYTPIAEYYDTTGSEGGNRGVIYGWFGGVYDGQDYVIADMNIKGNVSSCAGLFGVVYNGTLQNIILYSSDGNGLISACGKQTGASNNVLNRSLWYGIGGLAGVAASDSGSAVQNCAVAGYTINADIYTASGGWGGSGIGGLVGISNMALSGCTAETQIVIPETSNDNDNMRIGGLVGACQQSITNCYAGGQISFASGVTCKKAYIGGIVGGSYMKPLQVGADESRVIGFIHDPDASDTTYPKAPKGWTDNAIYNCYSFVQLPQASSKIGALYALGGTGEINIPQQDPNKQAAHNHGTCTIENSYYLNSVKPVVSGGQKTDVNGTAGVTAISYRQLEGAANLPDGRNIYDKLTAFRPVTSQKEGMSLAGKYSFPPSSRTELRGRDYPFPTILTREGGSYQVHYGAWPNYGIERQEGGAPIALDIFAQPLATEQLSLTQTNNPAAGVWRVESRNNEVAAATVEAGLLTVQAVSVGSTELTVSCTLNNETYQLTLTVNVTAELHLAPQTLRLFGQDRATVPLQLLNREGQPLTELADYNPEGFKLTAINCSSDKLTAREVVAEGSGLAQGIRLERNANAPDADAELVNVSYACLYNGQTYLGSDALAIALLPAPDLVKTGDDAYSLTFAGDCTVTAARLTGGQNTAKLSFANNQLVVSEVPPELAQLPLEVTLDLAGQTHIVRLEGLVPPDNRALARRQEVYALKPDAADEVVNEITDEITDEGADK